jgi:hypothetical protein
LATAALAPPRFTRVVVAPRTRADAYYRAGRAQSFPAEPKLDVRYFGGKTIEHLTFTNVYLGDAGAWSRDEMHLIDTSLAAAMKDTHLNNVLAQYYPGGRPTSRFVASRVLEGPLPARVYRDTIEGFVAGLDASNGLAGFELASTVFCFMLPRGIVLVDRTRHGHQHTAFEQGEAPDSKHGLAGYHGSVHSRHGAVYYAVGVYSEGRNGIAAFEEPWKNVCATFYHELCEARTDPDIEDANRAGAGPKGDALLGWYSRRGGEIGDMPLAEARHDMKRVIKEVPLVRGGTAPIQLMWSNAVAGPEGPTARKRKALHV